MTEGEIRRECRWSFACGALVGALVGMALVAAGVAARRAAPHANAAEPMAVSTLPDGSKLCTYVHTDPDTGQQLYVTSAGGIWPRDAEGPSRSE